MGLATTWSCTEAVDDDVGEHDPKASEPVDEQSGPLGIARVALGLGALRPAARAWRSISPRVEPDDDALVFTADKGGPLLGQRFDRRFARAREAVGLPWVRFHDLRHSAGTTAAQTGASTRELMARLGHSTPRAALIYQHATAERDHAIAEGLDRIIEQRRGGRFGPASPSPREVPPDPLVHGKCTPGL